MELNNKILFKLIFIINFYQIFLFNCGNSKEILNFNNYNFLLNKNLNKPDFTLLLNKQNKDKNLENFLHYWNIIEKDNLNNYETTKDPYTIIIPKIAEKTPQVSKENLKEFLFEHVVPGIAIKIFNENDLNGNLNKNNILFKKLINKDKNNEEIWYINNKKVLEIDQISKNLTVIYIDGHLGSRDHKDHNNNNYDEHLNNKANYTKNMKYKSSAKTTNNDNNKIKYLINYLIELKLGTKVFQHFLNKSNLAEDIEDNAKYNILIPIDNAFQRWHPIDWGFYPFSVQEFTESVLRNHFIETKKPLKLDDIKNLNDGYFSQNYETLGGETILFRNYPTPNVNNVTIISDHTMPDGNEIFLISEVLFVSEAIVSRLHQMHKDKETPPLLAFPWFGAQFLSHSFLALERDSRFTQITRFLNTAEIAQFVSGSNYTFFVPVDSAFEKVRFDALSDEILSTEKVSEMLLNHFIRGRLYDRDLKNDEIFETLGGEYIKVRRTENDVWINNAKIIQSEIFVYNLGTMYFIDEVLFSEILTNKYFIPKKGSSNTKHVSTESATLSPLSTASPKEITNADTIIPLDTTASTLNKQQSTHFTTSGGINQFENDKLITDPDVEVFLKEQNDEVLLQDDTIETETPKALPQISQFNY